METLFIASGPAFLVQTETTPSASIGTAEEGAGVARRAAEAAGSHQRGRHHAAAPAPEGAASSAPAPRQLGVALCQKTFKDGCVPHVFAGGLWHIPRQLLGRSQRPTLC